MHTVCSNFMRISFCIMLVVISFSSFSSNEDDSDRKVRYGLRIGAPVNNSNGTLNTLEKNVYNLNFNVLAKIRLIGDFLYFKPEIGLPFYKDSVPTQLNLIVRVKTWEFIGGPQYNFIQNKFSSYGLNIGLSKKIIEQITIGFNCYAQNKNLGIFKESHIEQNFILKNVQFNIQFRF